ncbi:hypothetical protein MY5147_001572 [Beauveria neobassiana]
MTRRRCRFDRCPSLFAFAGLLLYMRGGLPLRPTARGRLLAGALALLAYVPGPTCFFGRLTYGLKETLFAVGGAV